LSDYESRFEKEFGCFRPVIKEVMERYLDCSNMLFDQRATARWIPALLSQSRHGALFDLCANAHRGKFKKASLAAFPPPWFDFDSAEMYDEKILGR